MPVTMPIRKMLREQEEFSGKKNNIMFKLQAKESRFLNF